jgi:tetratricopeptide (TPR) repeat protein
MRLGVRAVLVLIAVLGCGLGWEFNAWKSWRLRQGYLHQAAIHAAEERLYQSQLKHYVKEDVAPPTPSENEIRMAPAYAARWAANRDQSRRFSAYVTAMATAHARLRRKYEQATANPLEPVEPDPPLPQQEPEADSWLARRDYARALAAYGEQIRLYPEFDHAYERRAWIWATCPDPQFRDGRLAVESATRACELTNWKAAAVLDTLATAYAESGDFEAAIKWQRKALELAPTRAWKGYQEDRLALYMAGKPYRQAR